MNISELELLEKWQADPSFINWANESNEVDIAKWNAFFAKNTQYAELADLAKFSIIHLEALPSAVERLQSQAALDRLRSKIATEAQQQKPRILSFRLPKFWRMAASFLLVASLGLWAYTAFYSSQDSIVWSTENEKKEILLNDGTTVILNKNSSLSYFENDNRNVQLTGEAFFKVTKKPIDNVPFTVTTKDLVVKVLGTQFNVKANEENTSVYLDEGKVQLALNESNNVPLEMEPGYLVSYTKKQPKVIENRKADALENTAWKEKVILFEEASLSEILKIVSKVYKVNFDYETTSKNDQNFTGGIPVENLDITLETLRVVFDLDIQKVEAKYLIETK